MFFYIVFALLLSWLITLTVVVFKTKRHYQLLTKDSKHKHIDEVLERLGAHDEALIADTKMLKEALLKMDKDVSSHMQKVGITRFNPFGKASGSDQSFVLSLLDKNNTGVVINFVYTHEGVRLYSKHVHLGKGKEYPLTPEEEHAVVQSFR